MYINASISWSGRCQIVIQSSSTQKGLKKILAREVTMRVINQLVITVYSCHIYGLYTDICGVHTVYTGIYI